MLTRSTSGCLTSSCQSAATCSMPNSFAITSARSGLRLAIATTFAPMQSRKPGICVVRANPVPIIPIPTGDLFMALLFSHRLHRLCNPSIKFFGVATHEAGDHGYELAGADGFGDVHLVAGRECLASIDIAGVGSQSRRGRVAAFVMRKRSHLPDKTVAILFRHRDVAQNYVGLPVGKLRERFMRRLAGFHLSSGARDYRTDDLACFRFVVNE